MRFEFDFREKKLDPESPEPSIAFFLEPSLAPVRRLHAHTARARYARRERRRRADPVGARSPEAASVPIAGAIRVAVAAAVVARQGDKIDFLPGRTLERHSGRWAGGAHHAR